MPANRGQKPPDARAAKRKGAALRAKSSGALQPIGRRRAKAKAKPEIEPAKRIAGVKQRGQAKAGSLVAFSESDAAVKLSKDQIEDLVAWSRRLEKLAEGDPKAYLDACRSGKQL
jgi:hypothetical protein